MALQPARASASLHWLLVAVLVVLAPLAYASPPDQTWIPGLYDDSDFDDVVLFITSSVASLDHRPAAPEGGRLSPIGFVSLVEAPRVLSATPASVRGRAPPRPQPVPA